SIEGLQRLVQHNTSLSSVGIISTKATVLSGAYLRAWPLVDPSGTIALHEQPSGPLVSLVEEPDINFQTISSLVEHFLHQSIKESDAVLIGCTHFSSLVPVLSTVLKENCVIVDSALFAAAATEALLDRLSLRNPNKNKKSIVAYVSDNPE